MFNCQATLRNWAVKVMARKILLGKEILEGRFIRKQLLSRFCPSERI